MAFRGRLEWDSSPAPRRVSEYNALRDPNMRHYFENRSVQSPAPRGRP